MNRIAFNREGTAFVDTPQGIFTAAGVWFRTSEAALRSYAGPVLHRTPLPRLLESAEVWLRSAQTLVLWLLPVFLLLVPPLPAILCALTLYVGWRSLSPSLVLRPVIRLFAVLERVTLQTLYYVGMMTLLAWSEQYAALAAGLGGFMLLRWGVVARATDGLVKRIWASLYDLPVPDQVLRSVLIRTALRYRLPLPELERMEREVLGRLKR